MTELLTTSIPNEKLPTISVIVVTYNCAQNLRKCLQLIRNQSYPSSKMEILVIDGGSDDETCSVAKEYGAKVITKPEYRDNQEARRGIGLKCAKNEILVYIDSDNFLPHNNWLMEMIEPLINDQSIIGTQTLRYTYTKTESLLNRYYALFGVNDPVAYYLNKMDRISWAQDGWNLKGHVLEENDAYYKVRFDSQKLPTLGCNGFVIRRNILKKVECDPEYFFHIDVTYDLAKFGFSTYGIVKNDIIHLTGDTFYNSLKKRYKYMKIHHQKFKNNRRYQVYDSSNIVDNINVLKFVLYTVTFVKPFYDALKGFLKIRDIAWFLHPLMCFCILIVYGYGTLTREEVL